MFMRLLIAAVLSIAVCLLVPAPEVVRAAAPMSFKQLVTDIQRMLTDLGYNPGPVDGAMGERTRQAIRRYQSNTGLPVDGHPTEALRRHLLVTTGAAPAGNAPEPTGPPRKEAWRGRATADAPLRIAPSGASASRERVAKGTELGVIRRQGAWLEVRVIATGTEGWIARSGVASSDETAPARRKESSGGFFANLSRGISRLLGGSREAPEDQGNVTVGIRGLAAEDLAAAVPDPAEVDKLDGYRVDRDAAYRFAGEEQLTAQTVEYFTPTDAGASRSGVSGRRED